FGFEDRLLGQQSDGVGLRKLGGAAKPAVLLVVGILDTSQNAVDQARIERAGAGSGCRAGAAAAFEDGGDDLRLSCPVVAGDAGQCVGHLVGRQVGGAGQNVALRGEEGGGRPAAHVVALVDVRPDVVVDPHGNV